MKAVVKYLRSETGVQKNCKILHKVKDKVYDFINMSEGNKSFVVKYGKKEINISLEDGIILIPYAVNNDYRTSETVYCFDTIEDSMNNERTGFFASLHTVDKENKNMFGIQPLFGEFDNLYWSNEVVSVIGAIHPDVYWISRGDLIDVSRENCNINTSLRVSTDLKVKCPTCKNYHPNS